MICASLLLLSMATYGTEPDNPNAGQVLSALQARSAAIENVMIRGTLESLEDGKQVAWKEQERFMDQFGRLRLKFREWTVDASGSRQQDPSQPSSFDILFDGETRIDQTSFEGRDRFGAPLPNGDLHGTYRSAQVFDGKGPGGLETQWNPLTYGIDQLLYGLIESSRAGRDVQIESLDDAGLYSLTFLRDKGHGTAGVAQNVAIVDSNKAFVPMRIEGRNENGRVIQRIEFEYEVAGDSGIWVPRRFSMQLFHADRPDAVPQMETRFVLQEAKINDPHFDESVFVATLEPDTAVSDLRYKVVYRVGDEKVLTDQLKALAEEAKRTAPAESVPLEPAKRSIGGIFLLILNAVIVVGAVAAWFIIRRRNATVR